MGLIKSLRIRVRRLWRIGDNAESLERTTYTWVRGYGGGTDGLLVSPSFNVRGTIVKLAMPQSLVNRKINGWKLDSLRGS